MKFDVQGYYDRNTARFLRYGQGGAAGIIHRAVWAPGVEGREEALQYVNRRVAERAAATGAVRSLDAGCGVGATMRELLERGAGERATPGVTGVTISPVQARAARAFLARTAGDRSSGSTWNIRIGDFCDRPFMRSLADAGPFDLVYFIESFIHAPCGEALLEIVAEILRPGGRLIICDDVLTTPSEAEQREEARDRKQARRFIREYREGWHVANLRSIQEITAMAEGAGFSAPTWEDLTPYLELGRPRDVAIRALVPLLRLLPLPFAWRDNFIGGNAIQECLRRGVIGYAFLEFTRR